MAGRGIVDAHLVDQRRHPHRDPHGDPIPCADGTIDIVGIRDLSSVNIGESATVERIREVLQEGMRGAPGVLFVGAAGNAGASLQDENPATRFSLPNFIMVGAVDRNGEATEWTNTGAEISLFANGDRVPARLPGGTASFPSGTSMAAPLVANAAARMLVANPELSGAQLRMLLEGTATPNATGQRLLHPRHAVEAARAQAGRQP